MATLAKNSSCRGRMKQGRKIKWKRRALPVLSRAGSRGEGDFTLNQDPSFISWDWMFLINELRHHSQPNFLRMDIKNHGEDWGFSSRDKRAVLSLHHP